MKKFKLFCLAVFVSAGSLFSQIVNEHFFTTESMNDLDYDQHKGVFWSTTRGGLVWFDTTTNSSGIINEGFPSNELGRIAINDSNGDVWVSTPSSVARVRNGAVTNYPQSATTFTGYVYNLQFDRSGVLWLATGSGLFSYDGAVWKKDNFQFLGPDYMVYFYDLVIDENNGKWLRSSDGLLYRGDTDSSWSKITGAPMEFNAWSLYSMALLGGDTVLVVIDDAQKRNLYYVLADDSAKWSWNLVDTNINFVVRNVSGRIWCGSWNGVSELKKAEGEIVKISSNLFTSNILSSFRAFETIDGSDKTWIIGYRGLNYYDGSAWIKKDNVLLGVPELEDNHYSVASNTGDGKLWFINYFRSGGALALDWIRQKWTKESDSDIDGISSATVERIAGTKTGDWILSAKDVCFKQKGAETWVRNSNISGASICAKQAGSVWIGGYKNQIHQYSESDASWKTYTMDSSKGFCESFTFITAKSDKEVYLSGVPSTNVYESLFSVNLEDSKPKLEAMAEFKAGIHPIDINSKGEVWGISKGGTRLIHNLGDKELLLSEQLPDAESNKIISIFFSPDDELYVGTEKGFYIYKDRWLGKNDYTEPFSHVFESSVDWILFDQGNNIVVMTGNQGIFVNSWTKQGSTKKESGQDLGNKLIAGFKFSGKQITYCVSRPGNISLAIYDLKGKERKIFSGRKNVGEYALSISNIPAGKYICRMMIDGQALSKPIVIIP